MKEYLAIPQPDEVSIEEREDAMGGYFMMFASLAVGLPLPIINLIAAIIYYGLNKKKSPFVHFHSLQSLISQIPTSLLNAGLVFWFLRIMFYGNQEFDDTFMGYFWTVILANILYFVFSIIAAVRARKGRFFYFVFFGRIAYEMAYIKKDQNDKAAPVNKPPR